MEQCDEELHQIETSRWDGHLKSQAINSITHKVKDALEERHSPVEIREVIEAKLE